MPPMSAGSGPMVRTACAVIGRHPIFRVITDEGLYGLGEVEFTEHYLKP